MELSEKNKQKIIKLYNTHLHKNIKQYYELLNKTITQKNIKFVIDNIESNQLKTIKKSNENFIPIVGGIDSYQIDLTFYNQFKKQNNWYVGLLNCININTKYLYSYPFKNKNKSEMKNLIEKFINDSQCKIIECDAGWEFINNDVKNLIEKNNIKLIVFNKKISPHSTAIVERVNKSIRDRITNYMDNNKTNKWIDVIEQIINSYNNTTNSSINQKPSEADETKIYLDKKEQQLNVKENIKNKFNIGDNVRIAIDKKIFDKGWQRYSNNIYKIIDIENMRFKCRSINDNNDIIDVLPYQMKKINLKNLISKKQTRNRNVNKKETENEEYKKDIKFKRKIKKEGL